jgi:hypothetical protein
MFKIKQGKKYLTSVKKMKFGVKSKAWKTQHYLKAKEIRDMLLYNGIVCDIENDFKN